MKTRHSKNLFLSLALLTMLIAGNSANAQQKFEPPTFDPPAQEVVDEDAVYAVYYAAPSRTGFFVVGTDRDVVRGPYRSYEEAYAAGMEQWWILFNVEEEELPRTWFYWQTFDTKADANSECQWFRSLGFDCKIKTIWQIKMKPESIRSGDLKL